MNTVQLIGRLTKDVELRFTPTGKKYAGITLAVQRDKDNADFVPVVIWEKLAENLAKYCKQGSLIGIVGRVQTRKYQNQDGKTVYVTDILARECQFLSTKGNSQVIQETTVESEFGSDTLDIAKDDLPF